MIKHTPTWDEFNILNKVCSEVRLIGTKEPSDHPLVSQAWTLQHDSGRCSRLEWYFYGPNRAMGDYEPAIFTSVSLSGGHISRFCLTLGDWVFDWPLRNQRFDSNDEPVFPTRATATPHESVGQVRCMNKSTFDRDILFLKMVTSDDRS